MASNFSINYDNRGKLGQAVNFNPDNDNPGLWIEASESPNGESGGIFMNGNVICLWSPGDNDLLRVLDEDSFPAGTPVFRIAGNGAIFQRGVQIHADYVFAPDYKIESIEEHAAFMRTEQHLRGVPKGVQDERGNDVVEYGSLFRGLLEELEKAHIYIADMNEMVKRQQEAISGLTAQVQTLLNR